jgi:hypothetical protein
MYSYLRWQPSMDLTRHALLSADLLSTTCLCLSFWQVLMMSSWNLSTALRPITIHVRILVRLNRRALARASCRFWRIHPDVYSSGWQQEPSDVTDAAIDVKSSWSTTETKPQLLTESIDEQCPVPAVTSPSRNVFHLTSWVNAQFTAVLLMLSCCSRVSCSDIDLIRTAYYTHNAPWRWSFCQLNDEFDRSLLLHLTDTFRRV